MAPWEERNSIQDRALDTGKSPIIHAKPTVGFEWDWDNAAWKPDKLRPFIRNPPRREVKVAFPYKDRNDRRKMKIKDVQKKQGRFAVWVVYLIDFSMDFMGSAPDVPRGWTYDDEDDKCNQQDLGDDEELLEEIFAKDRWDELVEKIPNWKCLRWLNKTISDMADAVHEAAEEDNDESVSVIETKARSDDEIMGDLLDQAAKGAISNPEATAAKLGVQAQAIGQGMDLKGGQLGLKIGQGGHLQGNQKPKDDRGDSQSSILKSESDRDLEQGALPGMAGANGSKSPAAGKTQAEAAAGEDVKTGLLSAGSSSTAGTAPPAIGDSDAATPKSAVCGTRSLQETTTMHSCAPDCMCGDCLERKRLQDPVLKHQKAIIRECLGLSPHEESEENEPDEDQLELFDRHAKPADGVALFTKIHTSEVFTVLTKHSKTALRVKETAGFVSEQVLIIAAGTKKEEINKVRSRGGAVAAARLMNMELMWELEYEHEPETTVAVEDFYWQCQEFGCLEGNGTQTVNKHSATTCRRCGKHRPTEVDEYDECLVDLRNRFRKEYGRSMIRRSRLGLRASKTLERLARHTCINKQCRKLIRCTAPICKYCAKPQFLDCPMPDCPGRVKPGKHCPVCQKKPSEDTMELANYASRIFLQDDIVGEEAVKKKGLIFKKVNSKVFEEAEKRGLTWEMFEREFSKVLIQNLGFTKRRLDIICGRQFEDDTDRLQLLYKRACDVQGLGSGENVQGLSKKSVKQLLNRLLPFMRASEHEVEAYFKFATASQQAAVPWCMRHHDPVAGCKFCQAERDALTKMLEAGAQREPPNLTLPKKPSAPAVRPDTPVDVKARRKGGEDVPWPPEDYDDEEEKVRKKEEIRKKKKDLRVERKEKWEYQRLQNQNVLPTFIVCQSAFAALIWFYFAVKKSGENGESFTSQEAGMDDLAPGETTLRTHYECHDLRGEIYRYWTYQFTHYKISHISGNVIYNLVLGWRLNKLNGNAAMALFYWLGVLGGALVYFVWDVHITTFGMSGGSFSLLGQRIAYLFINWKQKRYRWGETCCLMLFIGLDMMNFAYSQYKQKKFLEQNTVKVSHSTHTGGALMGLLLVLIWGVSIEEHKGERLRKGLAFVVLVLFVGFTVTFRLSAWAPWDLQNPDGYCWLQLVYNSTIFNNTDWHCVQCGEEDCPKMWVFPNQQWTANVTYEECKTDWGGFCEVNAAGQVTRCWDT
jgi:membrane associated rhomboid family serine protease